MGFSGKHFTNKDDVFDIVKNERDDSYCFALQVDKFDTVNDDY
jgi:hypothetical protein